MDPLSHMKMMIGDERVKIGKDLAQVDKLKELYQAKLKPGLFFGLAGMDKIREAHKRAAQ